MKTVKVAGLEGEFAGKVYFATPVCLAKDFSHAVLELDEGPYPTLAFSTETGHVLTSPFHDGSAFACGALRADTKELRALWSSAQHTELLHEHS